jgi:flagellar assembly protein FliH
MVSIIRSPIISDQKRKLSTRRPPVKEDSPTAAAPVEQLQKANHVPEAGLSKNLSPLEVTALVEQARLSVLAQVKDEAEEARDLGRQRGMREGRLAGIEEAKQSFAAEITRVKTIADNLQQALESGIHGLEDMAVAIAYEAACKVLGNVAVTREGVQALVRQTAAQALNSEKLVVRLHPADLAMMQEASALDSTLPAGSTVSWKADKTIALGGCVLATDGGELDARLETQVDRLRTALVAARRSVAAHKPGVSAERRKSGRRDGERAR